MLPEIMQREGIMTTSGGTVVTIAGAGTPAQEVLEVTGNTSKWFHVMHPASSSVDGAAIANQGALVCVFDRLTVTIASANDDDGVVATLLYEVVK